MTDLREIIVRWQPGWGVARSLPVAEDLGPGLRVHCAQPGREVECVALDADRDLSSLRTPSWSPARMPSRGSL